MAITFPASPTVGQVFTSGGVSWTWDGVKWTGASGWSDAPADNNTYGRMNGSWNSVNALIAAGVAPAENNAGRNLVANPGFTVAQRGAGPWTVLGYTADRWQLVLSGSTASVNIQTATDGDRASIGDESVSQYLNCNATGTSGAGDFVMHSHKIESLRRLANKTVTVSFYANSNVASFRVGVSIDQYFGTGGSPSVTVNGNGQSVTLSGTAAAWTRNSLTFTLPSLSGKTLGTNGNDYTQLIFWLTSGTTNAARAGNIGVQSGVVNIWGVQLEIGNQATPLDKGGSPQAVLAECQRFYVTLSQALCSGYAGAANSTIWSTFVWPVTMRATPSVTLAGVGYTNASGLAVNKADPAYAQLSAVITAVGVGYGYAQPLTASADL